MLIVRAMTVPMTLDLFDYQVEIAGEKWTPFLFGLDASSGTAIIVLQKINQFGEPIYMIVLQK